MTDSGMLCFLLSLHSGWGKPEGLLCLCPERPEGPGVWLVWPSPRGSHHQSLSLQLSKYHQAQWLPHSRSSTPAVSRSGSTLPGLPCPGQEACGELLDSGRFRRADHPGPHYLLYSQETQGVLLMTGNAFNGSQPQACLVFSSAELVQNVLVWI